MLVFRSRIGEYYSNKIGKYLDLRVDRNFFVTNVNELSEVTSRCAGTWGVLVIDATILEKDRHAIERIVHDNPQVAVGIVMDAGEASDANLRNATVFREPTSTDEFLIVMHYLFELADTGFMRAV